MQSFMKLFRWPTHLKDATINLWGKEKIWKYPNAWDKRMFLLSFPSFPSGPSPWGGSIFCFRTGPVQTLSVLQKNWFHCPDLPLWSKVRSASFRFAACSSSQNRIVTKSKLFGCQALLWPALLRFAQLWTKNIHIFQSCSSKSLTVLLF